MQDKYTATITNLLNTVSFVGNIIGYSATGDYSGTPDGAYSGDTGTFTATKQ